MGRQRIFRRVVLGCRLVPLPCLKEVIPVFQWEEVPWDVRRHGTIKQHEASMHGRNHEVWKRSFLHVSINCKQYKPLCYDILCIYDVFSTLDPGSNSSIDQEVGIGRPTVFSFWDIIMLGTAILPECIRSLLMLSDYLDPLGRSIGLTRLISP